VVDLRRSLLPWGLRARERRVIPRSLPSEHRVTLASRTLGLPPQAPRIWIDDSHTRAALEITGGTSPIVAIGPGANWICKTWPIDRFIRLADALTGDGRCFDGARLLLVGGAEELEISRPFWRAFPADRIVEAFGADVPTTAALLARCNLFVGNDSAMMHLAAAVGIPTVGLFGPTNEEHYGPWGDNGLAVRTPEPVETLLATRRRGEPDRTLLGSLTVEAVLDAIAKRWPDMGGHRAGDGADDRIRIASDG
jgi:ADP-heptose:LPS heptosyltransferase